MTKDQKRVLKALGVFVGVKVALFISIHYAGKVVREAVEQYS